MEKVKIIVIAESVVSGVRTAIKKHLACYDRSKYEVHLVLPIKRKQSYGNPSIEALIVELSGLYDKLYQIDLVKDGGIRPFSRAVFSLCKYIKKENISLIDSHNYYAGMVGRLAAKICGIHSIHSVHLYNFHKAKGFLKIKYFIQELLLSKLATEIAVAVSETEFLNISNFCGEEKTRLIHNSVDPPKRFPPHSIGNEITFGYLGRIEHEKRVGDIISSFIACNNPKTRLLIAGSGSLKKTYEKKFKAYKQVVFLGYTSNVDKFFNQIDVYIQPSLFEGMSFSILEAMAKGKPIITTNCPGNKDLVENNSNGFLLPPKSIKKLSESMKYYCEHPETILEHGEHSYNLILKKGGLAHRSKILNSLIEEILR